MQWTILNCVWSAEKTIGDIMICSLKLANSTGYFLAANCTLNCSAPKTIHANRLYCSLLAHSCFILCWIASAEFVLPMSLRYGLLHQILLSFAVVFVKSFLLLSLMKLRRTLMQNGLIRKRLVCSKQMLLMNFKDAAIRVHLNTVSNIFLPNMFSLKNSR